MRVMTFHRVVDLQDFINRDAQCSQTYMLIFRSQMTDQPWCVAECSVYEAWSERKIHLRDIDRYTRWQDAHEFAQTYAQSRHAEMLYA